MWYNHSANWFGFRVWFCRLSRFSGSRVPGGHSDSSPLALLWAYPLGVGLFSGSSRVSRGSGPPTEVVGLSAKVFSVILYKIGVVDVGSTLLVFLLCHPFLEHIKMTIRLPLLLGPGLHVRCQELLYGAPHILIV